MTKQDADAIDNYLDYLVRSGSQKEKDNFFVPYAYIEYVNGDREEGLAAEAELAAYYDQEAFWESMRQQSPFESTLQAVPQISSRPVSDEEGSI